LILAILATLGATVVAFVLYPVFSASAEDAVLTEDDETAREVEELAEKKMRLYESITDLDFEKAAGKVSQTDYESARNDYLAQVAQVIARLDEIVPPEIEEKAPVDESPSQSRAAEGKAGTRRCGKCGEANPGVAKFCIRCGTAFPKERTCDGCGSSLPPEAKFCMTCGKKVAKSA
jgi:ribosomal protein L40E